MQFILRWVRPSALLGKTRGLRYVGKVTGRKVYTNLPVAHRSDDRIDFTSGSTVTSDRTAVLQTERVVVRCVEDNRVYFRDTHSSS